MDIVPSFLMVPGEQGAYDGSFLNNIRLRIGEVQEIVYPSDKKSRSKKFIEYRVFVQHRENGTATTKMYENCVLSNLFGGFADQLHYTLRTDKSAGQKNGGKQPGMPGKGAKVLLLCVNGETHSPIIIGGLREVETDSDPKDGSTGHNLFFEFNGVNIVIDKDGQLVLTVKGATKADGKPADGVATDRLPSTVKVEKDGKITASTKDGKNSVVIEQSGKITITSEKEFNVVCNGKAKITAKDKCTVISKMIELGGEGVGGIPFQGVVLGSWVEPLTGKPVALLGGTSNVVFAKK
jgi:hypothetical protein